MSTRLKGAGGAITVLGLLAIFTIGGSEALRLYTYKDPIGRLTYCWGETLGAVAGRTYTKEECDRIFIDSGLARHERALQRCLVTPNLVPTKTYVAMLSLAYNIGEGGFCKSSIARRWNVGDRYGSCNAFTLYTKAKGRVLRGLVNRRKDERTLCVDGLDELVTLNYENDVAPEHRPVLRLGSRGFWVEQLQRELRMHNVDGRFGTATEALVKQRQESRGLKANGVADRQTWEALR